MTEIAVAGLWHLGTTVCAAFLDAGLNVLAFDESPPQRATLARGEAPTGEPGVAPLLSEGLRSGRLRLTSDISQWAAAEMAVLAYDSETSVERRRPDPRLSACVAAAAAHAPADALLAVMSQVAVGTNRQWRDSLLSPRGDIALAYVPENLRLGSALRDFLSPPVIVIGADAAHEHRRAEQLLALVRPNPDRDPLLVSFEEAELGKHAINAYLALCICFGNELGWLCGAAGADAETVVRILRSDPRVSPSAPVRPGPAFSGATLQRDLMYLSTLGQDSGRPELFDTVLALNDRHGRLPVDLLAQACGGLVGRRIALLGLTYKYGTAALRDSLPLRWAREVLARNGRVTAYDPFAEPVTNVPIERTESIAACVDGADAVLVGCALPELVDVDWSALRPAHRLLVDGCQAVSRARVETAGWAYRGLSSGA
jgi:UDPglucose 6-dehydrogenase